MSKLTLLFCMMVIIGFSCKTKTNTNEVIIPINDMRKIVWDMFKADEYYIRISAKDTLDKTQTGNLKLYDQVFRAYGISKKRFYFSYQYYQSHPDLFKTLIDSVDALSTRQREISLPK